MCICSRIDCLNRCFTSQSFTMPSNPESAVLGGGASTTTVSVETVTGFHVLKVEGFSQFKGLGVGKHVNSGTFTVGGHSWCISFFPDGYDDSSADWICVDLYLDHTTPASGGVVKACFTLSLLHKVGEPLPSHSKASTLTTFSSTLKSCGFREFIKRKDLESSSFSVEDSFRIRCDVTVVREIVTKVTESGSASTAPSPSPSAGRASRRRPGWWRRSPPAARRDARLRRGCFLSCGARLSNPGR